MSIEDRGRFAGRGTVAAFEVSTNVAQDYDRLVDRRRSQRRNHTLALALTGVAAVFAVLFVQSNLSADSNPEPMEPVPGLDVGNVPVWYDDTGLHRGDVVEQTPIDLRQQVGGDSVWGALALVRTGAVYSDPATGDVWFHPWGGDPRIVGHNSEAGPGGDPDGDTAAWFEGSDAYEPVGPGELVVYDTAAGREISRTSQRHGAEACSGGLCGDHYPAGNGFLQVSAKHVVWSASRGSKLYSYDVPAQRTTVVEVAKPRYFVDVQGPVEVSGESRPGSAVERVSVSVPGVAEARYSEFERVGRLSRSGDYLLAVEFTRTRHAAAIVDTRTGELWRVPKNKFPWIAWSYGDIALVDTEDELLACDAARRTCESLPAERPFLMPTN